MDAMTRAALTALIKEVGFLSTLKLGLKLTLRGIFTDPFKLLEGAVDDQEIRSRDQLRPAVLLYRILLEQRSQVEALRITQEVVQASGRAFLNDVVGGLDIHSLIASEHRETLLRKRLVAIPNASFTLRFEEDTLHFTVNACRFVGLCQQLGHPELASLFCSVDDAFFGHDLEGVSLERETTIANGGHHCPFVFTLNETKGGTS